jgi:hypothetical protein
MQIAELDEGPGPAALRGHFNQPLGTAIELPVALIANDFQLPDEFDCVGVELGLGEFIE